MELFCTVKSAAKIGDVIECSVFILWDIILSPGTKLEQRRGEDLIAVWELVEQKAKSLILKVEGTELNVELADGLYANLPVRQEPVRQEPTAEAVLVFGGKNWKLASPKKWVPMSLSLDGYDVVGELNIGGKDYLILKLPEGFAAKIKKAS